MKYTAALQQHFEAYFGVKGDKLIWEFGPKEKLHPDFYILQIKPNEIHNMWAYCTVGMSLKRNDEDLIELIVYSPKEDKVLVELLTVIASYHRNGAPLNIHHTVNIGQPWIDNSKCDHGFISLPYLDGEELELFKFENKVIHCYWFIPITEAERDYKVLHGCEKLEDLFEEKQLDYLNPDRASLVS